MKRRGLLVLAAAALLAGLPACQAPPNQPAPQARADRDVPIPTESGPGHAPNPEDEPMPTPGADTNQGNGLQPPMGGGR